MDVPAAGAPDASVRPAASAIPMSSRILAHSQRDFSSPSRHFRKTETAATSRIPEPGASMRAPPTGGIDGPQKTRPNEGQAQPGSAPHGP
jgi:hypothetical protein